MCNNCHSENPLFVRKPGSITTTMTLCLTTSRALSRCTWNNTRAFSALDRAHSTESYESVLDTFAQHRACAVLRTPTSEACPPAMGAAVEGGFKIVEFTMTTPDCLEHVADFRSKNDGKVSRLFRLSCCFDWCAGTHRMWYNHVRSRRRGSC